MVDTIQPIFLFSLQRSGSTLCQRILAAHPAVATASETHMLLPYFYSLRERGVYSEYAHHITSWAIQDFAKELPGGVDDYLAEIRELALRLYTRAARGQGRYFLDKAAKYHLIVEDIIRLFPEAKFIFLWRNPLAVISSLMESWEGGRWNVYHYEISLYQGLANLVAAYQAHAGGVCAIRYEDAVTTPESVWPGVFDYLELDYNPSILTRFADVQLKGRVGDQWGMKQYASLSKAPVEKWKKSFANPLRKAWARRYLRWLGKERLAVMGYDLSGLLGELDAVPTGLSHLGSDLVRFPLGAAYRLLDFRLLRHKLEDLRAGHRIYIHT